MLVEKALNAVFNALYPNPPTANMARNSGVHSKGAKLLNYSCFDNNIRIVCEIIMILLWNK